VTRVLHFWMGPVQGFIGSARRTRDLWAGSFLLSWLSGHAMKAVLDASGGALSIPWVYRTSVAGTSAAVVEPTLRAILNPRAAALRWGEPLAGTLPNQFRAVIPDKFDPELCREAALSAWQKLGAAVFETFVRPAVVATDKLDEGERAAIERLWKKQIPDAGDDPFWEFAWVVGDNPQWEDEVRWLDRRKSWRTHTPPAEDRGYDHCAMMPDFAELSGFVRSWPEEREKQDAFWDAVRRQIKRVMYQNVKDDPVWLRTLELREHERLCAIALVKRLFPLLPPGKLAEAIGWIPAAPDFPEAASDRNAALALRNWPSTAFMSAVHWIERAWGEAEGACRAYAETQLLELGIMDALSERPQHHKVKALSEFRDPDGGAAKFSYLDGTLFFPRALETNRYAPPNTPDGDRRKQAERLSEAFEALRKKTPEGERPLGPPSPFYALLFMDGDRLGKWVSASQDLAEAVSAGLGAFATAALKVVRETNGVPIYAGADDLAALYPIEDALPAAIRLRALYQTCLDTADVRDAAQGTGLDPSRHATISAGLVFADFQAPLSQVREEARRQLDGNAKARNGRDSLAVAIVKSGGRTAQWVSRWDADRIMADGSTALDPPPLRLWEMARAQGSKGQDRAPISSRFPYLVRERLGDLFHGDDSTVDAIDALALLRAEFEDARRGPPGRDEAKIADLMSRVLHLSRGHPGPPGTLRLSLDGMVIAQFLADACIWPPPADAP
jgi:CRISPR-associated protein Cmr2